MLKKAIKTAMLSIVITSSTLSYASNNGENVIFIGYGPAKSSEPYESDSDPISLGYLKLYNENNAVLGFDISREGTKLDSTWGQENDITHAFSLNFLLGTNLTRGENSRFDAAVLLGIRNDESSCPPSYLGYQCYADREPDNEYAFNYGGILTFSYKNFMLGVRATGESTQALFGYRF